MRPAEYGMLLKDPTSASVLAMFTMLQPAPMWRPISTHRDLLFMSGGRISTHVRGSVPWPPVDLPVAASYRLAHGGLRPYWHFPRIRSMGA